VYNFYTRPTFLYYSINISMLFFRPNS
jgi:hypothetical protein